MGDGRSQQLNDAIAAGLRSDLTTSEKQLTVSTLALRHGLSPSRTALALLKVASNITNAYVGYGNILVEQGELPRPDVPMTKEEVLTEVRYCRHSALVIDPAVEQVIKELA